MVADLVTAAGRLTHTPAARTAARRPAGIARAAQWRDYPAHVLPPAAQWAEPGGNGQLPNRNRCVTRSTLCIRCSFGGSLSGTRQQHSRSFAVTARPADTPRRQPPVQTVMPWGTM
ncbi:hypothetical protein FAGKG844_70013 [Frankia sp. AgKG'84/4]